MAMTATRAPISSERIADASKRMCALFGANFREARLKAGMTQTDVEEITGIRQHYVSEIEHGLQNPTLYTMATLAGAIAAEVRSLLMHPPKRG
jgi:transcriptional regulator with XRE-family HTH domain